MRDLYKRLGIDENASQSVIRDRLSSTSDNKLVKDASTVLLNPDKRRVYDRCNRTLRRIGRLRANLYLKGGINWNSRDMSDYSYIPGRNESVYDVVTQNNRTNATRDYSKKSGGKHSSKNETSENADSRAVIFTLVFLAIIMSLAVLSSEDDSVNNTISTDEYQNDNLSSQVNTQEEKADKGGDKEGKVILPPLKGIENQKENEPSKPKFDAPAQPLPVNGYTYNYTDKEAIAPFEIRTPSQSNSHYFVKLENYYNESLEFIIFIRAGQSVMVDVPLGTYTMKYATGKTWYGMKHLFGPGEMTDKFKAEQTFKFERQGYDVSGYTVELIMQEYGNLQTSSISDSEW